jgi:hypothetical protein
MARTLLHCHLIFCLHTTKLPEHILRLTDRRCPGHFPLSYIHLFDSIPYFRVHSNRRHGAGNISFSPALPTAFSFSFSILSSTTST